MITTTVPIAISPEAAERVNQLGFQKELEAMLDRAMQSIPGLVRIEVSYTYNSDFAPEDPVELAAVIKSADIDEHLRIMDEWNDWKYATFSGKTGLYFTFITLAEYDDAV